jgi:hypothetical protein
VHLVAVHRQQQALPTWARVQQQQVAQQAEQAEQLGVVLLVVRVT